MTRSTKPVREFTVKDIAGAFALGSMPGSPPIGRDAADEGWYIRIRTSIAIKNGEVTEKFDYFRLDDDGHVLSAPRGYAKDYRPGRVTDIKPMAMMAEILGRVS